MGAAVVGRGTERANECYEELLKELAFELMVERGLDDSRAGRSISNVEMAHRIRTWSK